MTSSQPVATPNALNFTPDNKHCYGYSGKVSVSGSNTLCLDFQTNSEYIVMKQEIHGTFSQIGQSQIRSNVLFNSVDIIDTYWDASLDSGWLNGINFLIVPPFTHVQIYLSQATGSDKDMSVTITGEVHGMADIGYQ